MRIRRQTFAVAVAVAAVAALSGPSLASAKQHLPPGSSQLDQYIETLPGPGDNRPAGSLHGGGGHDVIPAGTAQQLEGAGAAGQGTANLAEATTPAGSGGKGHRGGDEVGQGQNAGTGSADSGPGQVTKALFGSDSGSEGMGIWLPLLLAAILVAGVGYIVRDRVRSRAAG